MGQHELTFSIGRAFGVAVDSETFTVTVGPGLALGDDVPTWSVTEAPPWQVQPADGAALAANAGEEPVQAYPNPFRSRTEIAFSLDTAAEVRLAVFDLLGREVAVLIDGPQEAGRHQATFDAAELPSGIYLWRLDAGAHQETGRLTLLR